MSGEHTNNFPKLHNAAWPGVVGKGDGGEPPIDLETMLDLTAAAEVEGVKFEGVDLFLSDPHVSIDSSNDALKRLAESARSRGLVIGSVVAPVWPPTGGGSAMDEGEGREKFLTQVRKGCRIGQQLRELGVRPYGVVRIDSACGPSDWLDDPEGNQKRIAETFRQACDIAADHGERLAAEGEICWGGMHSWKRMVQLLEIVDRPGALGFQADMAHTLLYTLGANAPEDRILPENWNWDDAEKLDEALEILTAALRPWTIDFHVAQNDATVFGSGSHDKTGRHCLPNDPNGKLDIPHHAGFWLRDENGELTKACQHVCWDGCMFPNETMMKAQTWNDILGAMVAVRDAHGWVE
jgi:sugar phosphate isomerase/epimerase